jgi:hypothetical protein
MFPFAQTGRHPQTIVKVRNYLIIQQISFWLPVIQTTQTGRHPQTIVKVRNYLVIQQISFWLPVIQTTQTEDVQDRTWNMNS